MTNHKLDRRSLLASTIAAGLALRTEFCSIAARAAAVGGSAPLKVRMTLNGKTYDFDETRGHDLGDYVGNGFRQRCVLVTVADLPMSVLMRPDRNSNRVEVVFELGRLWSGPAQNLGAYSVEILRGETRLARIDVPQHYWFSRWRWQSERRPVVAKVDALIHAGLLPPYGNVIPGPRQPFPPRYSPMELAGVTPGMPNTGERPDIGPLTEWQANWLCTQSADVRDVVFDQAEASGTAPWYVRDEKTGAPFSIESYPDGGWYGEGHANNPEITRIKTKVIPDVSHQPALTYLPFLLTGDPYYLEALQFQATWGLGWQPAQSRQGAKGILFYGQTRGYAWSLRNLMQIVKLMPESAPSWLLPRSYWQRILDNNRSWFVQTYLHGADPQWKIFRAATRVGQDNHPNAKGELVTAPWQEEFLGFILGWMVLMGFDTWREIFLWKLGSTIARTNGKSGWVRAYATPYHITLRRDASSQWVQSWSEAWALNKEVQHLDSPDPNRWASKVPVYLGYTRGVLALAVRLGIPEAKECFAWADEQIRANRYLYYKWSVVA